jgi:hypothetical protein
MELNVSDFHSFTYYFISILILNGANGVNLPQWCQTCGVNGVKKMYRPSNFIYPSRVSNLGQLLHPSTSLLCKWSLNA